MAEVGGDRFLVSMLGDDVRWVRNVPLQEFEAVADRHPVFRVGRRR
ncbi:hypothetical protein [Microbacterium sp.]|nr:hypothetical protein [Microbacterium sp.]HET6302055.1 hypothetical protein [Microbacterium sp.]